jgi:uncharacterized protein
VTMHDAPQSLPRDHPFTVLIEPLKGCNMACRYCYADVNSPQAMDPHVLEIVVMRLGEFFRSQSIPQADIIWHGGEPMLAGLDFFRHMFTLFERDRSGTRFKHFIQTNGTLLDREWCALIREKDIGISISLDGPREVNEKARASKDGAFDAFDKVMEKSALLDEEGIGHSFLVVVSRANVEKPRELYDFFSGIRKSFKINPVMRSPFIPTMMDELGITARQYGTFLCTLFDIWMNDENCGIRIGTLDTYIKNVRAGRAYNCQHRDRCLDHIMGIRPDGGLVLCSRFQGEETGNLCDAGILSLREGSFFKDLERRAASLGECLDCDYYRICYGGCPHHAHVFSGDYMKKDYFCPAYRMIYSRIDEFLKEHMPCT